MCKRFGWSKFEESIKMQTIKLAFETRESFAFNGEDLEVEEG